MMAPFLMLCFPILHCPQIGNRWAEIELFKQPVLAGIFKCSMDFTRFVVHVAKNNGLSGARLLTSGLNVTIDNRFAVLPRSDLAFLDALHAHRTLFHHATSSHGDVGIKDEIQSGSLAVLEPIETTYLYTDAVCTITRTNTTVVSFNVQPFVAVNSGQGRTYRLAGALSQCWHIMG
ncbi:MAG: hypothetical protein H6821_05270 [Planctomycetaceae bacterium]|nr:hypothetical protein [Planctomycetaceae bacterium]